MRCTTTMFVTHNEQSGMQQQTAGGGQARQIYITQVFRKGGFFFWVFSIIHYFCSPSLAAIRYVILIIISPTFCIVHRIIQINKNFNLCCKTLWTITNDLIVALFLIVVIVLEHYIQFCILVVLLYFRQP